MAEVGQELFRRRVDVTVDTLRLEGFDVAFSIEKTIQAIPNVCDLQIFNLNQDHRAHLESLRPKWGARRGIPVKIEAGYESGTSLLWLGDLRTVSSVKQGPDWITTLSSGDGEYAYQTAQIQTSFGPKTDIEVVLRALARELGVGVGNTGAIAAQLRLSGVGKLLVHGTTLSGQVSGLLDDWCRSADLEWSIQDGVLQLLNRGKVLAGRALLLSSETGLVESPTVDNKGFLTAKMLMVQDVRPGQLLVMAAERIKGNYRVVKANYEGDTFGGWFGITVEAKRY